MPGRNLDWAELFNSGPEQGPERAAPLGMQGLTSGWRFLCHAANGRAARLSLADLDQRLDLGLRGGACDVQALIDAIADHFDLRVEAYFNGSRLLSSQPHHRVRGAGTLAGQAAAL